jgi:hypothetical protein
MQFLRPFRAILQIALCAPKTPMASLLPLLGLAGIRMRGFLPYVGWWTNHVSAYPRPQNRLPACRRSSSARLEGKSPSDASIGSLCRGTVSTTPPTRLPLFDGHFLHGRLHCHHAFRFRSPSDLAVCCLSPKILPSANRIEPRNTGTGPA